MLMKRLGEHNCDWVRHLAWVGFGFDLVGGFTTIKATIKGQLGVYCICVDGK